MYTRAVLSLVFMVFVILGIVNGETLKAGEVRMGSYGYFDLFY